VGTSGDALASQIDNRRNPILEECRTIFNHICIVGDTTLARLIGYAEDAADAYYHVREIGGREVFCLAVGACESLKEKRTRYKDMDNAFALNGCPPADEFRVSRRNELNKLSPIVKESKAEKVS
jgi:hypothetical protein